MELRQLRSFVAVADAMHFLRLAEESQHAARNAKRRSRIPRPKRPDSSRGDDG